MWVGVCWAVLMSLAGDVEASSPVSGCWCRPLSSLPSSAFYSQCHDAKLGPVRRLTVGSRLLFVLITNKSRLVRGKLGSIPIASITSLRGFRIPSRLSFGQRMSSFRSSKTGSKPSSLD